MGHRAHSRLRHGAIRLQCVTTDMPHPSPRAQSVMYLTNTARDPSAGMPLALGSHMETLDTIIVCARRSSSQLHHGRALVEGQPGIGALDHLTELDAPFPDGWAPPFPIGFAFFCLSLLSRHSHWDTLALCSRALLAACSQTAAESSTPWVPQRLPSTPRCCTRGEGWCGACLRSVCSVHSVPQYRSLVLISPL